MICCTPRVHVQVALLLRKVRPEWTADTFKTVPFTTHGDQQTDGQLRELGQGAFTGGLQLAAAGSSVQVNRQTLLGDGLAGGHVEPITCLRCLAVSSAYLLKRSLLPPPCHAMTPAEVIDRAVADGSVDIGVHSLKDTPIKLPDGVELAACLPRDDPRCARQPTPQCGTWCGTRAKPSAAVSHKRLKLPTHQT